jgi:hypothetical protein
MSSSSDPRKEARGGLQVFRRRRDCSSSASTIEDASVDASLKAERQMAKQPDVSATDVDAASQQTAKQLD